MKKNNIPVALCLAFIASGCHADRRATRQLARVQARQPNAMAAACAAYYPATDSVSEKIAYKEGTPLFKKEIQYVTVNCDSIINARYSNSKFHSDNYPDQNFRHKNPKPLSQIPKSKFQTEIINHPASAGQIINVPCPPCDSVRVDTVYRVHYERNVDRAQKTMLDKQLADKDKKIAALQTNRKWWMYLALVFGIYSILRWVLRAWNIRLP